MRPIGIHRIARLYGVRLSRRFIYPYADVRLPLVTAGWDGRSIALYETGSAPRGTMMVLHEIAHWVVCPSWRRSEPEFGLGEGGHGRGAQRLISEARADAEERLAAVLAILMARDAGRGAEEWGDFFDRFWVTWAPQRHPSYRTVAALQRRGHVDMNGETAVARLRVAGT